MLLRREDEGSPIECVARVVDCAAWFWRLVHSAEVLPLRGAHFRACGRGTGWGFSEEVDDEVVGFKDEEAGEFVEPEGAVDARGWGGDLESGFGSDRGRGVGV